MIVHHPRPSPLWAYSRPTRRAPTGSWNRDMHSHEELNATSKVSLRVKVIFYLFSVIVRVRVVLRKTVVGEVTLTRTITLNKYWYPWVQTFAIVVFAVVLHLKQLQRNPRTHDLRDTGVMLYQLSYEALLVAGQVRVQFIPVI